ncbi:8069_t:CDS:2, partial [Diversispora eburnea]
MAKTLNEGTYQSTVIVLTIRAVLKNLPLGPLSFISTSERQNEDDVIKFVETLLLLQNILITNISLLCHGSISKSQRQMEESTTVSTP